MVGVGNVKEKVVDFTETKSKGLSTPKTSMVKVLFLLLLDLDVLFLRLWQLEQLLIRKSVF